MNINRVVVFALSFLLSQMASAVDIYVSTTGNDSNSGVIDEFGVTNFLATVQKGLTKIKAAPEMTNTVWVAPGTYVLDSTIQFGEGRRVVRSLTGKPEDVILRGDGTRRCISGASAARPVIIALTVENGYPDTKQGWAYLGGGICLLADGTGSVISNCVVRNCAVSFASDEALQGAGIYAKNTRIVDTVVSNCSLTATFANKTTNTMGGGLVAEGQSEIVRGLVTNCFVSGSPKDAKTLRGGGVFLNGVSATELTVVGCKACDASGNNRAYGGGGVLTAAGAITNCSFVANTAQGYGGGLVAKDGNTWTDVTVVGGGISNNVSALEAGGIYFCSGTLDGVTIAGNEATGGVGAGLSGSGSTTLGIRIANCRFLANIGRKSCGALQLQNPPSSTVVTNCQFVGNSSSVAGVTSGNSGVVSLYKATGNFQIRDCVFTNNVAVGSEPLVSAYGKDATYVTDSSVRNCLFADNAVASVLSMTPATTVGCAGVAIENCTVVSNVLSRTSSFALAYPGDANAPYYRVRNCAFLGNLRTNASPVKVANVQQKHLTYGCIQNSFSDEQTDTWFYTFTNDVTKANVIGTATAFASPMAGDWRPRSRRSPLVDAGVSCGWHEGAKDLAGNPRISGTVDIGAFEYCPKNGLMLLVR